MSEINLDAEINELAEQIASEGAKYVQKKLMAEMPSLLEYAFYNAYEPIWYNRTDNIKNNSYFPYSLKNSKMYEGGIEVSSAFMDEYEHGKWTPEKVKYIEYTNFEVVCFYVDKIIANSMFDKNGDIKVDSCQKYLQYIFTLLSFYTNIDIHAEQWILEFNKLRRYRVLEEIIKGIPETEVNTLDAVLEMKSNDAMTNYYNIQNWATKKLGDFYPFIAKGVNEVLESLSKNIENLDENKIRQILESLK